MDSYLLWLHVTNIFQLVVLVQFRDILYFSQIHYHLNSLVLYVVVCVLVSRMMFSYFPCQWQFDFDFERLCI